MDNLYVYINRQKITRFVAYFIDIVILLVISMVVFPILNRASIIDVMTQIRIVQGAFDVESIQSETLVLTSLLENFTIAFAMLGCLYDIVLCSICHTTLGKAVFQLRLQLVEKDTNLLLHIIIRSVVKAAMLAFFGSILIVLSVFSVIASPEQVSIQDRISKMRVKKKHL